MPLLPFTQRLRGLEDTQVQRAHEQLANASDGVIAALNRSFSLATTGITALLGLTVPSLTATGAVTGATVTGDLKNSTNFKYAALQGYFSATSNTGNANWLGGPSIAATWVAPYAGSIAAVSGYIFCSGAATQTFDNNVYKNGTLQIIGSNNTLNGTSVVFFQQTFAPGANTFVAGDYLQLNTSVSSSLGTVTLYGNCTLTVYA